MFLVSPKLNETTYSATVDDRRYEVDITKFPKDRAVALAIEEIREIVNAGIAHAQPAPVAPKAPAKRGRKPKSL